MSAEVETFSPEKRATILRGAGEIFARDGYEGASMSRIAQEAGVSKGTLYNYFAGKADLFAAYVESECSRKLSHVFDGAEQEEDPARALAGIARRVLHVALSPTGLTMYRVVAAEAAKFPELARIYYEAGPARAIAHLSAWLERQTRAGRLRVPDPGFAAEQFFALCQTRLVLLRMLGLREEAEPEAVARVVDASVTMFLNTYGA